MDTVPDMSSAIGPYARQVEKRLADWTKAERIARIWSRDPTLWSGADEDRWLGWLGLADRGPPTSIQTFREIRARRFQDVLLFGMGGSSQCARILRQTFDRPEGSPRLHVLDSTLPGQVARIRSRLSPERTLYIVASKSGTTTETGLLCDFFLEEARRAVGDAAGSHFAVITDPGTPLEALARQEGFAFFFPGEPDVGGRFSALSSFGGVPARATGVEFDRLLRSAADMAERCGPAVPCEQNPGAVLGITLAELALQGRDKVTLVIVPELRAFGPWLEQLLAESTGKRGRGLIPIEDEPPGPADLYGDDRLFVCIHLASPRDLRHEEAIEAAGHPVIRIALDDRFSLGGEFFRWEMAAAVAASVLGVNPFDQPNVQESKALTAGLTEAYEQEGELRADLPFLSQDGIAVFADDHNAAVLSGASSFPECIRAHLRRLGKGDYLALCAYLDPAPETLELLQAARVAIRARTGVATTLGFGPRYLHSTGQMHKQGPDRGLFVIIDADEPDDLPIPGRRTTFGVLSAAQALGDFTALNRRGRRLIRLHLSGDLSAGLSAFHKAVLEALS